jgi:hypothetical protein
MTENNDDMKLTAGFTCLDCGFFQKCISLGIASANSDSKECDFAPSKFVINAYRYRELREDNARLQSREQKLMGLIVELKEDGERLYNWTHNHYALTELEDEKQDAEICADMDSHRSLMSKVDEVIG